MSKVIFFNLPGASGHINPTVGLVKELVDRGEHVIYYAGEDSRLKFTGLGAEFRTYEQWFDYQHNAEIGSSLLPMAVEELNMTMSSIDGLIAQAKEDGADYIIYDSCCPWGKYVAASLGIPGINSITTIVSTPWLLLGDLKMATFILWTLITGGPRIIPMARRQLIDMLARINVPYQGIFFHIFDFFASVGDKNIVFNTREYQPFDEKLVGDFEYVGASIPERRDDIGEEFKNLNGKPLVYVSLGTLHNSDVEFYRNTIKAFKGTDYYVIMSVGRNIDMADLGELPANVKAYPFVPQLHILKHAKAFVTHGGMNSLNEGLYFGVPVVVCPQQFEQAFNGRRLEKLGIAKTLGTNRPSSVDMFKAVREVVENQGMSEKVKKYSELMKKSGGYRRAADIILDFVGSESTHNLEDQPGNPKVPSSASF